MEKRFRVSLFGPLVVDGPGGPVDLGPVRRRALFAVLLFTAGRPCSKQFLLDAVWGDRPPATGDKVIASYVYALRRALDGPGVPPTDSVIGAGIGGYHLEVAHFADDASVATRLAEDASGAWQQGDAVAARNLLRSAEDLWRGEPLSTLPGPFAATERARLADAHAGRVDQRIDLDLELGGAQRLIPELGELLAADPTREATAARLMRALHAAGRRGEALAVFEATRRSLHRELGVRPTAALRVVHQEVLTAEDDEAGAPDSFGVATGGWQVRCDLPTEPAGFVGRDAELESLCAEPEDPATPTVRLLDGMGGAGKTRLALRAAHRLAERYPDGQLCVDLHGHTPGRSPAEPAAVLGRLLHRVGVPDAAIPADEEERAALWRAMVAGRRVLLVLDNAVDVAQIRPLLPGSPGCLVLVTSRQRLAELDAPTLAVGMLAEADAVALFDTLAPAAGDGYAARRAVVRACGHLPLAVRIAAARLRNRPTWTVQHLARRLADASRPFIDLGGPDGAVQAAFADSYAGLGAAEQDMFRALGALPGGRFAAEAAASATGTPGREAEDLLGSLLDANLLDADADGRYRLHDLLRRYAMLRHAERPAAERELIDARVLDHYLCTLRSVNELCGITPPISIPPAERHPPPAGPHFADAAAGQAWVDAEFDNILELLGRDGAPSGSAAAALGERVWQAANQFVYHSHRGSGVRAWSTLLHAALTAAQRAGSVLGEQLMNVRLGNLYNGTGPMHTALVHHRRALELAAGLADPYHEAHARHGLAVALSNQARYADAITELERVVPVAEERGYDLMRGSALNNQSYAHARLGHPELAIAGYLRSLDWPGVNRREFAYGDLGVAYRLAGDYPRADTALRESLRLLTASRNLAAQAYVLAQIGSLRAWEGNLTRALDAHRQSMELLAGCQDIGLRCAVLERHADTLLRAGQPDRAAAHYRQALNTARQVGFVADLLDGHVGLARCAAATGDAAAALAHWRDAWRLSGGLDLPVNEEIRRGLGDEHAGVGSR